GTPWTPPPGRACRRARPSRIQLIGLGGVGCAVLPYLLLFLDSLRQPVRLALIDGDDFEAANSARMAFATLGNKAEVKAAEAVARLGASAVTVAAVPEYVTAENLARLLPPRAPPFPSLHTPPPP